MNIVVTGSSGFVGSLLIDTLIEKGHYLTAVDMAPLPQKIESRGLRSILADTTKPGDWQDEIQKVDAVINLTGKNIFRRWTKKYKKMIYDSRILTTRHVVDALSDSKPVSLVSTSAAGYYGDCGDEVLDESKGAGDDFLAQVCVDWEKEAFKARKKKCACDMYPFRGGARAKRRSPVENDSGLPHVCRRTHGKRTTMVPLGPD